MREIFLILLFLRDSLDSNSVLNITGIDYGSIIAILIIVMFLLEILSSRKLNIGNAIFKNFSIYFILLLPSVFLSEYLGDSLKEYLKYFCELSCIYLSFIYCKKDNAYTERLTSVIMLSSIIPSLVGFYQIITQTGYYDKEVGGQRVYATFAHPNQYAIYLVVIITVGLLVLFNHIPNRSRYIRKLAVVTIAFSMINLLFTYSRTCWVWLAIVILGILLFNIKKKRFIVLGLAILVSAYYLSDLIMTRFLDIIAGTSSMNVRSTIVFRMMIYALKKPIVGHGLGTFDTFTVKYINTKIQAHNEYFKTLFESGFLGIVGLILYLVRTLIYFVRRGIKDNYIIVFFLLGFIVACYFTNTLSSLIGQIYLVTTITVFSITGSDENGERKL